MDGQTSATNTENTGTNHTGTNLTGTNVTGTHKTGTALTQISFSAPSPDVSSEAAGPELGPVKGVRLQLILLLTTVALVLVIVSLLGALSALSTQAQFSETAEAFTKRFQEQAREVGQTVSRTISLTSATALRDSNYAFLSDTAKQIIDDNRNVLRVRILDADRLVVADTDPEAKVGEQETREVVRRWVTSTYQMQPVFEYQEPIDYGAQAGSGLVILNYSMSTLQAQLRELETSKQEALRSVTVRTAGLGFGFVLLAALVAAFQSRRITRPLDALSQGALRLARGELKYRVESAGSAGREVNTLGVVFNHMADRIMWLLEDVRNKAALERDVQLARTVQETLLPRREPFMHGALRIAGACETADACGGDWWLRAALDERRAVLGIGDVTGHGLATALVASSATSGFAAALRLRDAAQIDAGMLITSLNQTLFQVGRGEYQMSSSLAVIDTVTGALQFASGAHPAAYVFNRHDQQVGTLLARGPLLGAAEKSAYTPRQQTLRPGDVVVWYTDGLTEAADASGKAYGAQRMLSIIQQNSTEPAERIRDALLNDVREYTRGVAAQDDITVIVAEYSPEIR